MSRILCLQIVSASFAYFVLIPALPDADDISTTVCTCIVSMHLQPLRSLFRCSNYLMLNDSDTLLLHSSYVFCFNPHICLILIELDTLLVRRTYVLCFRSCFVWCWPCLVRVTRLQVLSAFSINVFYIRCRFLSNALLYYRLHTLLFDAHYLLHTRGAEPCAS